jgi:hypothetical protein
MEIKPSIGDKPSYQFRYSVCSDHLKALSVRVKSIDQRFW